MCGIAGIINLSEQRINTEDLLSMRNFLKERGPDNLGLWQDNKVGFVHSRLSIIDLSSNGNQPMSSINDEIMITYNGEIYNFIEIRKELKQEVLIFLTDTDTEVISLGYWKWGIDKLLSKLDGMFAFAIYDKINQKVIYARDIFGKKPLYLMKTSERVLFSSDIRSIWVLEKHNLNLNYSCLDYYLTELSSPQPLTIWNEIEQVKPSTYSILNMRTHQWTHKQYWNVQNIEKNADISLADAIDITQEKLTSAILKRTVSDVPIGCFLSGGVDSGLVTSILASHSKDRIKTFSVGFDHKDSELPDAKRVAERYNTDHHEIILESEVTELLPDLIDYIGEPFADSSLIPSYFVTKYISQDVKVALSGDGGDEIFGGYNDYLIAFKADQLIENYPNKLWRKLNVLSDKVRSRIRTTDENLGRFDEYPHLEGAQKLYRNMGFSWNEKRKLLNKFPDEFINSYKDKMNEIWGEQTSSLEVDKLMRASLSTRLLNDYLVKVDRSSMMNSLEVRSPFLDKDLAEFGLSLPSKLKFHQNKSKFILKTIATKYVSHDILSRPKKGFGIPLNDWLRSNYCYVKEMILDQSSDLFDSNFLEKLILEHKDGHDHTHKLWSIMCFNIWQNKFNA